MKVTLPAEINNVTYELEKYVVARYVLLLSEAGDFYSGSWWFYGTYEDEQKALSVADEINGAVFMKESV